MRWAKAAPVVGLVLILSGIPIYMALMTNPTVRSTGWPTFLLAGIGLIVALWGATKNKTTTSRIVAGGCVLLSAFFVYGFFGLAKLPEGKTFDTLTTAPEFVLADTKGKMVKLSDAYARGPVLLVFYRGDW